MEVCAKPTASQIKNLRCVIVPTDFKHCPPQFVSYYVEAYQLWKSIWAHTLKNESKVKESDILYSDNYLLQDEAICLFSEDKAIAIATLAWLNLNCVAHRECSYFSDYPSEIVEELAIETPKVLVAGGLVVDNQWRRRTVGFRVAELVISLTIKRFLETSAQVYVGITRNNRRIHEIIYHYGAHPLCKNILSHGVLADVIAIYHNTAMFNDCSNEVKFLMEKLWDKRIIVGPVALSDAHSG